MAHQEQHAYFSRLSQVFSVEFTNAIRILEVGSQNINGSVREFFPGSSEYLGIDLAEAPDVDWVVPGELIELPDGWADIVISTECFEHCEAWDKVLLNMIRICKPSGLVVITCATTGRATHGTIDSDQISSPFTTSYYRNLNMEDIAGRIAIATYFTRHAFEVNSASNDLYFWGLRSEYQIIGQNYYFEDPLARLARAQGQLGQAASRHALIEAGLQREILQVKEANARAEEANARAEEANARAEEAIRMLNQLKTSKTWKTIVKIKRAMIFLRVFNLQHTGQHIQNSHPPT